MRIKNLLLSMFFVPLAVVPALAQELTSQAAVSPTAAHSSAVIDPLDDCRDAYVHGEQQQAERCLRLIIAASADADARLAAREMLTLISMPAKNASSTAQHGVIKNKADDVKSTQKEIDASAERPPVSLGEVISSGAPELMLTSTLFGAVHGFIGMATVQSALRTNTDDSFASLLLAPALGAAGGLALSYGAMQWLKPSAGDVAMMSSAMFWGTVYGTYAQGLWELSAQQDAVSRIRRVPLRFALVLGSGLLASGVATELGPYLNVSAGDMGLVNSAALWGGLWTLMSIAAFPVNWGNELAPIMLPLAASVLSYSAAFALSPFVEISRPATWLIEAGALTGGIIGLGLSPLIVVATRDGMMLGRMSWLGLSLGLAGGTALAFVVDKILAPDEKTQALSAIFDHLLVAPALLAEASSSDSGPDRMVYGLTVAARF